MIAGWSTGGRPYAVLLLLCLALYVPGLAALPVLDRDEARFAQATRQMLETGDLLRPQFQNEARNKKPVGIYWLQAASVALLSNAKSTAIWPYRLPSLLGAVAAVLLTFAFGRDLVGNEAALLGAALLAASLALVSEAHIAKTDAMLLATVIAAQGALGTVYRAARRGAEPACASVAALFWAAQGIGILVKGPITPLVSLLTAGALSLADRDIRWLRGLRALWGIPVMLALAAPWFVAISLATEGAFLGQSLGHDFLGKLLAGQEAHGAPPGTYLLLLWITFWPGSLLLAGALFWAWRQRGAAPERFLIAWIVPFWILLEFVPTKLPHYILPAYPALALLSGRAALAVPARPRWLGMVVAVLWSAVALGFAAGVVMAPQRFGDGFDPIAVATGIVLAAAALWLVLGEARRSAAATAFGAALLAVLVFAPSLGWIAPRLDELWLSRSAAALVAAHPPAAGTALAAAGYAEPSLVFLLGTKTRLLTADQAALYLAATPGAEALVSGGEDAAFRRVLGEHGAEPRRLGAVAGLNYSRGEFVTLTLYASARE